MTQKYRWQITDEQNYPIVVLTDFNLVLDYEQQLRDKSVAFKTRMYVDNKPVSKKGEIVKPGMIHYTEI